MLNRRQFLLGVSGGATLAGLQPLRGLAATQRGSLLLVGHEETWANSICQLCPSACGIRVRLMNGHPVTVSGNPLHPINRGGLCARGAASLQLYYDPDRIAGPARRDPGLVGGWGPVSWDDALSEASGRLKKAVEAGRGRVAVIRGNGQDIPAQLFGRLVRAAGSEWVVDVSTAVERAEREVLRRMHGVEGSPVYDVTNARFLLSLDSSILDASPRTMTLHRAFAEMRSARGYVVHAAPRLGVTGSKADAWLPIRPGTAGILALGIAHMLIKEGYTREDFLSEHTKGFEDYTDEAGVQHTGVRTWILREFSPDRVSEATGIGWDQIIRVARQFGSSRRPLAVGPLGDASSVDVFDLMAVHTLNAIVGAIDVPGGVLLARQTPFDSLDSTEGTQRADGSAPTVEDLASWVLESRDPPIDVCIIHDADPVFTSIDGDRVTAALRKIPLVISTSPVLNDTVEVSGLVLPGTVWMERRCDATTIDAMAQPVVSLSAPAAPARADTRNPADVALALAKSAGAGVAGQFPWANYDEVVNDRLQRIVKAGVGDTFSEEHRSTWAQLLERGGWRIAGYGDTASLQRQMDASGGWWDPVYYHGEWRRLVPGSDHRVNLEAIEVQASPPKVRVKDGELLLDLHAVVPLSTRTVGSLPHLQDLASPLMQSGGWVTCAELNPETARELVLAHGDTIEIESERGKISARLQVSPAVRPDVVVVHTGGGRVHGGRYAAGIGSNPLRLVATTDANGRRRPGGTLTKVRVRRVA